MYQSMELLALPITDLQARIRDEIEKNPALEINSDKSVSLQAIERPSSRVRDAFENTSDPGFISRASSDQSDAKQQFLEGALARGESLQDHLLWQLHMSPVTPEQQELGEMLISNIDDNGFFRQPPQDILLDHHQQILDDVLALIREFDPPGVCAEGPIESLVIQTRMRGDAPEHGEAFITRELDELRKGRFDQLARDYGITRDDVEDIFAFIKTLNPYPGSSFGSASPDYIVPDITIRKRDKQLRLYIHDDQIPELKIDAEFQQMGQEEDHVSREARRYIQQSIRDANWLISSIEMRNNTLRKVGAALMKYQYEFFLKGPKFLHPMTLRHIAEEISVHETTVSRISQAKFIQTDWGIFPIKYFFSSAISSTSKEGIDYAKNSVKEIIRELIEEYTGSKRLSDQKISDMLAQQGIKIARRTVAKYRRELNIESSFERSI